MSGFRLLPVPLNYVDAVWPRVAPWLDRSANKAGDMALEEYLVGILDGHFILFTGELNGKMCMASVISVEEHAAGRVANVLAWGGESPLRAWASLTFDAFVPYAQELGATRIFAIGHHGLKKIVPAMRPVKTVYERRI